MRTLVTLPVELLYEVQLSATSHTLHQTCKTLHDVFKYSPPSFRAQYLVACADASHTPPDRVLTKILRYPICTKDVLEAYFFQRPVEETSLQSAPELPRRLFRGLVGCAGPKLRAAEWSDRDPPLPFLRYLYGRLHLSPPNANSHEGYALVKAVQAGFVPLVRFLLDHDATPAWKGSLSIMIAIHRRDLGLVRLLIERTDKGRTSSKGMANRKRQKLEDRVEVTLEMLRAAVKCRAQDIVEYLTREKGCIPDMQTLLLMR